MFIRKPKGHAAFVNNFKYLFYFAYFWSEMSFKLSAVGKTCFDFLIWVDKIADENQEVGKLFSFIFPRQNVLPMLLPLRSLATGISFKLQL